MPKVRDLGLPTGGHGPGLGFRCGGPVGPSVPVGPACAGAHPRHLNVHFESNSGRVAESGPEAPGALSGGVVGGDAGGVLDRSRWLRRTPTGRASEARHAAAI